MGETQESGKGGKVKPGQSQDPKESASDATSSISEGLSDSDFEAIISDPRFLKGIQKHTDKETSKMKKQVDEFTQVDRFQELTKEGLSPAAAKRQLKLESDSAFIDDLRKSGEGAADGGQTSPGSGGPSSLSVVDAAGKVKLDLDGLTNEQTDEIFALRDKSKNQKDFTDQLLKFKKGMPVSEPPGKGEIVTPGGRSADSEAPTDLEDITDTDVLFEMGMKGEQKE